MENGQWIMTIGTKGGRRLVVRTPNAWEVDRLRLLTCGLWPQLTAPSAQLTAIAVKGAEGADTDIGDS